MITRQIASAALGAWLISGSILCCHGQELAGDLRLEYLVRAAALLEQAGLPEQSAEIRQLLGSGDASARQQLLERKLAALDQLKAEIAQLRQLADPTPQVMVRIRLLKVDWARVDAAGLSLASLRHFDAPVPDDSGQLVAFLNALQKQGLLQILAEPTMVAAEGRESTFVSGGDSSARTATASGSDADSAWGTFIRCRPQRNGEKLRLQLELRHSAMVPKSTSGGDEGRQHGGGGVVRALMQISTVVEVAPGQTILLAGSNQQAGPDQEVGLILVLTAETLD